MGISVFGNLNPNCPCVKVFTLAERTISACVPLTVYKEKVKKTKHGTLIYSRSVPIEYMLDYWVLHMMFSLWLEYGFSSMRYFLKFKRNTFRNFLKFKSNTFWNFIAYYNDTGIQMPGVSACPGNIWNNDGLERDLYIQTTTITVLAMDGRRRWLDIQKLVSLI